jgi:lipopolysaccharide transport system ATP-binding protein
MSSDPTAASAAGAAPILEVRSVDKNYLVYRRPVDRLKQMFAWGRRQYYDVVHALHDVSFVLRRGEALGVLGRNGAGKSTLLQLVAGTVAPSRGEVLVGGRISALLELGSGFNPEFTGRENVFLNGAILGIDAEEMRRRFDEIAAFADIGAFIDRAVKTYSSGMFVRLAFAVATAVEPDLLIVDEALSVGDVVVQQRCATRIRQMRERGTSLLFVSHDLEAVKRICERAIVLEHGRMVREGEAAAVAHWYLARAIGDRLEEGRSEAAATSTGAPASAGAARDANGQPVDFPWLRHGDGQGRIVRSEVLGDDGRAATVFRLDETVTFRFDVRYDVDLPGGGLGFYLRDKLGTDVIGVNTFQQFTPVGPIRAGDVVRFEFRLPLRIRPGAYGVSPAAAYNQEELRFLDWIHNAVVIEIVDPTPKHMVFGIYHPEVTTTVRTLPPDAAADAREGRAASA